LSQILRINPIRYRYKADNAMGIRDTDEHIAVVAQEVQQVIPEAVTENSKGYLLVNNDPIIWSMLNAIKEQQEEIRALKSELRATQRSLQKVETQVAGGQPALVAAKLETMRSVVLGIRTCGTMRNVPRAYTSTGWAMLERT
jgi:hypothetical protein